MQVPSDFDAGLAREAVSRVSGDSAGLALLGPPGRIDAILDLLPTHLAGQALHPVTVRAEGATPQSLRDAVGRAHAGRPRPDDALLLIVPDAGSLSAALLRELEQAAEAAARFGGLKFLFGSTSSLRPILREGGLLHLHDRLDDSLLLPVAPVAASAALALAPSRKLVPAHGDRRPRRHLLPVLIALGALVLLLLAVALLLRPAPSSVAHHRQAETTPGKMATLPPAPAPGTNTLFLVAQPGDTLPVLFAKVYANTEPPPYASVQALNPVVGPGTRLSFPPPVGGWPHQP